MCGVAEGKPREIKIDIVQGTQEISGEGANEYSVNISGMDSRWQNVGIEGALSRVTCLGIKGLIAPKVELFSPANIVASEIYLGNIRPKCSEMGKLSTISTRLSQA